VLRRARQPLWCGSAGASVAVRTTAHCHGSWSSGGAHEELHGIMGGESGALMGAASYATRGATSSSSVSPSAHDKPYMCSRNPHHASFVDGRRCPPRDRPAGSLPGGRLRLPTWTLRRKLQSQCSEYPTRSHRLFRIVDELAQGLCRTCPIANGCRTARRHRGVEQGLPVRPSSHPWLAVGDKPIAAASMRASAGSC